jgi:hypothetical protein
VAGTVITGPDTDTGPLAEATKPWVPDTVSGGVQPDGTVTETELPGPRAQLPAV